MLSKTFVSVAPARSGWLASPKVSDSGADQLGHLILILPPKSAPWLEAQLVPRARRAGLMLDSALGSDGSSVGCLPRLLADIFFPLPLDPYAHIHAPLVAVENPADPRNSLYYTHKTTGSILGSGVALRMLLSILEGPAAEGGVGAGPLRRLVSQGRLSGWFPGRLEAKDAALARSWGALAPLCCQPLDLLQSLFGSKAALYFAFVAFVASILVVPATVGAAAFVHQQLVETPSEVAWAPAFALIVIMVLGVATKLWRRRERELALRWGLLDAHRSPLLRSEFKQPHRRHRSPVTGRPTYWQSATERNSRTFCAASCTATAMGVVVVVTLSTFLARVGLAALERQGLIQPSWSSNVSSVIGAVVVTITQFLYSRMAVCLTNWEEQPTDVEHDASLIFKQGIFNAVNVTFALLWTAFAQTRASLIFMLTVSVLFVVSLPLAPLLAIVYLSTTRLVDADKLIRATRRPLPEDVPGMGSWIVLLDGITRAAVVVNAAVVFFTPGSTAVSGSSAGFPGLFGPIESREQRLIAFVVVEAAVLGTLRIMGMCIPDQSAKVTLQASRQAYLVSRHIHHSSATHKAGKDADLQPEGVAGSGLDAEPLASGDATEEADAGAASRVVASRLSLQDAASDEA